MAMWHPHSYRVPHQPKGKVSRAVTTTHTIPVTLTKAFSSSQLEQKLPNVVCAEVNYKWTTFTLFVQEPSFKKNEWYLFTFILDLWGPAVLLFETNRKDATQWVGGVFCIATEFRGTVPLIWCPVTYLLQGGLLYWYGLKCALWNSCLEILTPCTSEYDLIWTFQK